MRLHMIGDRADLVPAKKAASVVKRPAAAAKAKGKKK
jgi:hypothetical protein